MKHHTFDDRHTPSKPYCTKEHDGCWCHTDDDYHDEVQHPERRTTESDVEVARSFFGVSSGYETRWGGAR